MNRVSIIIPAYNEEKRISKTLEFYGNYFFTLKKNKKLDYEIIVVINNTTDNTENIVKKYIKKYKEIKYLNFRRGGKGFAVMEGFRDALKRKNDLIGFVDADMATPPEEYAKLVFSVKNFDGTIADRYLKGSQVFPTITFRRLIVGRMFNFLIRSILFLPYRDTQCGAKVFKRKTIEKTLPRLTMSKWAFDVELLFNMKMLGFIIISFPTKWYDREYSKINFLKASPWMALAIVRLRIINSPFRKFIRIYDKFIGFIK